MDAILIEIETTDQGVEIVDRIQRTRFELHFDGEVGPAATDVVEFPVDTAVRLETNRVTVPASVTVWARSGGEHRVTTTADDPETTIPIDADSLQLNVMSAPMKVYLVATTAVSVSTTSERTTITADGGGFVLGVRSPHDVPAGTVTTTGTPRDFMRAISTFGSALQTTSPERSWQTLRGHPPEIELGDEFHVPSQLRPPETGIQIEVPPDLESVFTVSSLAYYLGAEVVPGDDEAGLLADGHFTPLGVDRPLYEDVADVFARLFVMDCVVRTEGIYQTDLAERRTLLERVDLDVSGLYAADVAARTAEYLRVDEEALAPIVPDLPLTTSINPNPENGTLLPYLADELSVIRPPRQRSVVDPDPSLEGFFRSENDAPAGRVLAAVPVDTPRHQWVGEGVPLHASRPTAESFRRRLNRVPKRETEISITVVCNDQQMIDEVSEGLYPRREMVPFDVSVETDLTAAEVRSVFEGADDFVHYIGHARDDGLQCADGWLDLHSITDTSVDAFLLNGCQSVHQGEALVDAGAIGGVVSLSDVGNARASRLGRQLSRLLAYGHTLGISLHILRRVDLAQKFAVVGLDGFSLCQCPGGAPVLLEAEADGDWVTVSLYAYQTQQFKLGSLMRPHIDGSEWYLNAGLVDTFRLRAEQHPEFFTSSNSPVIVDGELRWSKEQFGR